MPGDSESNRCPMSFVVGSQHFLTISGLGVVSTFQMFHHHIDCVVSLAPSVVSPYRLCRVLVLDHRIEHVCDFVV